MNQIIIEVLPRAAYIDISAVSYVIPVIAGIGIAVGSAIYFRFRKVKSKISKKLGIDENAGKEVEEDIVINDESANAENVPEEDKAAK